MSSLVGRPLDPLAAGDSDCDTLITISDAVYIIAYIFGGGLELCDPDDNGVTDC
ncbi:MAG: hypothetical protein KAT58_00430 [candidate division Zixibacteria bacterium]|nr:hypothetical protein [candidate division Zixibacteria bacterium]